MDEYQSPYENFSPQVIGRLKGTFRVPSYQRGYRWERRQMKQLLNDIYFCANNTNYFLQPIVVKYSGLNENGQNTYELIDGQQRLTSIFLILRYCQNHGVPFSTTFDLEYEIRKESREFLDDIEHADHTKYIDFLYMYHAYQAIGEWADEGEEEGPIRLWQIATALKKYVNVFWYEVPQETDSFELFSNLNIGKIGLNNAELIKALFLCKDETRAQRNGLSEEQQHSIALAWEDIEHQLGDDSLWAFMTNHNKEDYSSRIELLFDIIAGKKDGETDKLFTFLYFNKLLEGKSREEMLEQWVEIKKAFLTFRDWHNNLEYYHKIGYLVAVGDEHTLQTLYEESRKKTKREFREEVLDKKIKESIKFDYQQLCYSKPKETTDLLLLHNVISVLNLQNPAQRFPFHLFKGKNHGWSLEHIHAQQSETLSKDKQWVDWVGIHLKSLLRMESAGQFSEETVQNKMFEELKQEMQSVFNAQECTKDTFQLITRRFSDLISKNDDVSYIDTLSNMALLGKDDNSILNNSTFDAKRDIILNLGSNGTYVPLCTMRVFLKAYTPSDKTQTFAWGKDDRDAYIEDINKVLKPYLTLEEGEKL